MFFFVVLAKFAFSIWSWYVRHVQHWEFENMYLFLDGVFILSAVFVKKIKFI